MNKDNNSNPECKFCEGTGIAEYFDLLDIPKIGEGIFTLGYLCKEFGHSIKCPECFPFQEIGLKNNQLN